MRSHFVFILSFLFLLLLIPVVSAAEPDFVAPVFRNYTLSIAIDNSGIVAVATNTQCNATIKNKYGNYLAFNENMSIDDAGYASIDLNASALREIAQYPFRVSCISGGSNNSVVGILEITSSGEVDNNNNYLILFLSISAFGLMLTGIKLESYPFGFISGVLFFISAIYVFQYGIFSFQDIYSQSIASMFFLMGIWNEVGVSMTVLEEMNLKYT